MGQLRNILLVVALILVILFLAKVGGITLLGVSVLLMSIALLTSWYNGKT